MVQLPRSFHYRPAVLEGRGGGVLLRGLAVVITNWRCLTWLWFLNMVMAGLATIAFSLQAHGVLDHSFQSAQIQNSLNVATIAGLFIKVNETSTGASAIALALDFVFFVLMFVAMPGVLACFLGDEISSLGNMFRAGLRYFWRFVRFGLVAALIAAVVVGVLAFLRMALIKVIDAQTVTKAHFWTPIVAGFVIFAVVALLRLWFDFSEVCIVDRGAFRLGREEDRRAVRTLGCGIRLLKRGFLRLYGSFFLIGTVGWVAFLLCLTVWRGLPPFAPVRAFVCWQLGLFLLLGARLWQRGMEVAWFEREGGFLTPVADPLPAPELPVVAVVEEFPPQAPEAAPEPA